MEQTQTGWHRFLTPRDRAVLGATSWAKKAPFGLGDRPALLVVDDYYAGLGFPRMNILDAVREWPSACGLEGWQAIDRTVHLVAAARAARVPVVYAKSWSHNPSPWNRKIRVDASPRGDGPNPADIVAELAPHADDVVIEKSTPSAFQGTSLEMLLRSWDRDTILVCGEATSGCVRATVVDGCCAGFAIGVVAECCFDRFEASHWVSLFDMDQKYSDVIGVELVCRYLERIPYPNQVQPMTRPGAESK
ncbi:MAG TPA: isochorismatase family protein [Dermatophilaceae bacterium]